MAKMTKIHFPPKLDFLLKKKARYKSGEGGRGSAKSWTFAGSLLVKGAEREQRFLCCREFQKSIKDSVHQLLADLIRRWELDKFYTVQSSGIFGKNGTIFGFEGLRHNITNIKSWEGADVAWVEEAQTMSKASWNILPPTIRKDDSELWFSWNPDLEDDETWQRLMVNPPKDLMQAEMNWRDNPWFPEVLEKERLECLERDPVGYQNIWEGKPRAAIEGAIFAEEMRIAQEEGRIIDLPYKEGVPVDTYWDLGESDLTAIWFVQKVGFYYYFIDYYSHNHRKMPHYFKMLQEKPYVYGTHFLPHDSKQVHQAAERTIFEQSETVLKNVEAVDCPKKKADPINEARTIFSSCVFDKDNCDAGISCLRRYAYRTDMETGKVSKEPDHNIYSHGADAFLTFAVGRQENVQYKKKRKTYAPRSRLG